MKLDVAGLVGLVECHGGMGATEVVSVGDFLCFRTVEVDRLLLHSFDELLIGQSVSDNVGDVDDVQIVFLGIGDQVIPASHGAVVLDDLTDHGCWSQTGELTQIDRAFGVASAHQRAAVFGNEGEDMPRTDKIARYRLWVCQSDDAVIPLSCRDPRLGSNRIDRDGKGRLVVGIVVGHHRQQIKPLSNCPADGCTDEPPGFFGHEVDHIRSRERRRIDQISFVFPIFVIHHDDHPTPFDLFDRFFDPRYCFCCHVAVLIPTH